MAFAAVNPASGVSLRAYPEHSPQETARRLALAAEAFAAWRRRSLADRGRLLRAVAAALRSRAQEFAVLMAEEMGKPVAQGRAEAEKCAWVCEFYAEQAAAFLAPETVPTDAAKSVVVFEPLGPILAVMPWNFPFWQVFRAAAPALMAGNPMLLKHASNVPGCALVLERIFHEAGAPEGLFQTLLVEAGHVAGLIAHPAVRGVTLTGSTPAGRAVASAAGGQLKKTVLELGGSDPYVILEDADLPAAAETCAASRLINAGQSCISAKRFIVVEPVRRRFEELLVERLAAYRVGDPLREETTIGPLARRDLRDALHRQVQRSLQQGARLLLGGTLPGGPGAFYPPTALGDVRAGMPVYEEETFGPVAAIIPAADEADAIRIANDSSYGLGAAVFTGSRERGEQLAVEALEAGCCFVNALVRSDPRLPFGGIKDSGYGRELSRFGIREFVNIKSVYIR